MTLSCLKLENFCILNEPLGPNDGVANPPHRESECDWKLSRGALDKGFKKPWSICTNLRKDEEGL